MLKLQPQSLYILRQREVYKRPIVTTWIPTNTSELAKTSIPYRPLKKVGEEETSDRKYLRGGPSSLSTSLCLVKQWVIYETYIDFQNLCHPKIQ